MSQIKVIVNGALGRMGQQVVSAVLADPDLELLGGVDAKADGNYLMTSSESLKIPLHKDLITLIEMFHPDVVVDFTVADAAMSTARLVLKNGSNMVLGTTGLTPGNFKELDVLAQELKRGVVFASNFAIGAVVLMHLVKIASKYFDNAEIIELHHDKKLDAPSGTSLDTVKAMVEGRGKPFTYPETGKEILKGTRGGQESGVAIHSVRMPGYVASQQVTFGAPGQTLSIRHDTINRECYMPGVILAIKEAVKITGLVYGLDTLLKLGD